MILQTLFCFVLLSGNFSDTLILPLKEGNVKGISNKSNIFHDPMEAVIYPTRHFEVTSCSKGEVISINKDFETRFAVMIKSDSLFFSYVMDSVVVKKGAWVEKAQIIGKLKEQNKEEKLTGDFPLIFIVSKMEKLIDANKYLLFYKDDQ